MIIQNSICILFNVGPFFYAYNTYLCTDFLNNQIVEIILLNVTRAIKF